jgi:hypothetical protein
MNFDTPQWFPQLGKSLTPDSPLPQDKPFTLAEARAQGVPEPLVRKLLRQQSIRRVLKGVFVSAAVPDSVENRASALMLVVPESAVVTDRTAAWLHGVSILPRSTRHDIPPISIYQRRGTRVRRAEVIGGKRDLLDRDIMMLGGVQVTTLQRSALDLGRLLWRFDALAALDGFLRLGVTEQELTMELDRFIGFRGVVQLRTLVPLADGRSESPGESALRLHWYDAGLPRPELQWWVHDDEGQPRYRLDIALPELGFCAEYDGKDFHSSFDAQRRDLVRRRWLADQRDWAIEVFEKESVYGRAAEATTRLAATYRELVGLGWHIT